MSTLESLNCFDYTRESDRFEHSLDDGCLNALAQGCPNLKIVFFGDVANISLESMQRFVMSCPKVESIKFFSVTCTFFQHLRRLHDIIIAKLRIKHLIFNNNYTIDDSFMKEVLV
jgi:hypothetical protein